jgi:hypothetical protein
MDFTSYLNSLPRLSSPLHLGAGTLLLKSLLQPFFLWLFLIQSFIFCPV